VGDLAQVEDATLDEAEIRKQNKALKEISKLKSWFNPNLSRFLKTQNSGREMIVKTADFAFNMVDLVKDPESFDEAYNHPEVDKKIMWPCAISKELEEMKAKGVWEKIFRARLVACGYSQIP
jgi:phage terminase large subunit